MRASIMTGTETKTERSKVNDLFGETAAADEPIIPNASMFGL